MLPGQPSRTLLLTAARRAGHQLFDSPLIFCDPLAVGLVPEASEQILRAGVDEHCQSEAALRRSLFALRSRFAEDRLAEATARGSRQYVNVGAGLDTFAWRQPEYARRLRIFAVDHIATLVWTQVLFWERGFPKPPNLIFVPADLEDHRLGERLAEFKFDPDTVSFCSVLGVVQYLDRDAVVALLRFVSSLKRGSEIVFSFVLPDDQLDGIDLDLAIDSVNLAESLGEPWKTRVGPQELMELLTELGFSEAFHLTPDIAQQRYFRGRSDELRAPRWEQLIAATV